MHSMLTADEQFATSILSRIGLTVEKVPESTTRTPDLLAYDDTHRFLIEVKTRTDDATLSKELRKKRTAYRTSSIGPTKGVAGIFQHAMTQLEAKAQDEFQLVWVRIHSCRGAEQTLTEQVRHTLYGITLVVGGSLGNRALECYFFHRSTFYRYPQLDGAILTFQDRLVLCINTYSTRAEELRKSRIGEAFTRNILDPHELEREGKCLIADCGIDRQDAAAVLTYVSTKYGITNAVQFNFDEHAAFAAFDPHASENTDTNADDHDLDPWLGW